METIGSENITQEAIDEKILLIEKVSESFKKLDSARKNGIARATILEDRADAAPISRREFSNTLKRIDQKIEYTNKKFQANDVLIDVMLQIVQEKLQITTAEIAERSTRIGIANTSSRIRSYEKKIEELGPENPGTPALQKEIRKLYEIKEKAEAIFRQLEYANTASLVIDDTIYKYRFRDYKVAEELYCEDNEHFGPGDWEVLAVEGPYEIGEELLNGITPFSTLDELKTTLICGLESETQIILPDSLVKLKIRRK